jgi:uncharacterized protein YciI
MSAYAVIREAGPGWTDGGIADQPAVADHAAFMNALADDGFLLCAGPLAGSEGGRVRALLIVDADSEDQIRTRLADDPGSTRTGSCSRASSRGTSSSGLSGSLRSRAERRPATARRSPLGRLPLMKSTKAMLGFNESLMYTLPAAIDSAGRRDRSRRNAMTPLLRRRVTASDCPDTPGVRASRRSLIDAEASGRRAIAGRREAIATRRRPRP